MAEIPPDLARLRATHPEYTGPLGASLWAFMRDSLDGTGGFGLRLVAPGAAALRDGAWGRASYESSGDLWSTASYLPRYPREHIDLYNARVERAVYYGYVGPIAEEYQGFLHATPPQRATTSAEITRWWADADGEGGDVAALMARASDLAQTVGWAAVLVDRGEGERPLGAARTYARVLQPEELVDWQLDDCGEVEWARLRTCTTERDPFTGAVTEREQYTTWTEDAFERVDYVRTPSRDGAAAWALDAALPTNPLRGANPAGEVPLVILYQQRPRRPGRLYGTTFLYALARANLDLFGVDSQIDEHLNKQVFAILYVQSHDPATLQGLKLGTDNGLHVEMEAAPPGYLAPPSEIYITLAARREAIVGEVYRMATMTQPSGVVSEQSGVAKSYDFGRTNAALSGFAANLEAAERALVRLVAAWQDARTAPAVSAATTVAWPRTFDVLALDAAINTHLAVLEKAAELPPTSARLSRLAVFRRLFPQASPAEIEAAEAEAALLFDREVAAITPTKGVQVARVPVEQLTSFTLPYLSPNEVRSALNAPRVADPAADTIPALTAATAATDAAQLTDTFAALPTAQELGAADSRTITNGGATTGAAEAT